MRDNVTKNIPLLYPEIRDKCEEIEFSMLSDMQVGSLLRTLVSTKPSGRFLELGTGIGLALSWMVEGMQDDASITTIDNNPELIRIAKGYFNQDPRIKIICTNGEDWISSYQGPKFDLIFADAWPGKYFELDTTLELLNVGGMYVIDDMTEQADWPDGHDKKAEGLISELEGKENFAMVKLNWSTGIIIMTKLNGQVVLN